MKYPQRVSTHITETKSFKALDRCIPPQWMLRHVTERDYGVDSILEMVTAGGEVRGDMMALQLKGTAELTWRPHPTAGCRQATFSGVETTAVNYWMGLPMPVFLLVHDQATGMLVAADVKRQARREYAKLTSQASVSFTFLDVSDLQTQVGLGLLVAAYAQEKAFPAFSSALLDLLFNSQAYHDLVSNNLDLDFFLPVEDDVLIPFLRLYRNTATVTDAAGERRLPGLQQWFADDRAAFGGGARDPSTLLHYGTLERALCVLAPAYIDALWSGRRRVADRERDYWKAMDPLLVRFCESWVMQQQIEALGTLFSSTPPEEPDAVTPDD